MANHNVNPHATIDVQPNDTLEITKWPGAQQAGSRALLMGNLPQGNGGDNVPCYTAAITHTNEGSLKVVKVTVPKIPPVRYTLYVNTGNALTPVVDVLLG